MGSNQILLRTDANDKVKVDCDASNYWEILYISSSKTEESKYFLNGGPRILDKQTKPNVGLEC